MCDTSTHTYLLSLVLFLFVGFWGFPDSAETKEFSFIVVVAWLQTDMISLESQACEAVGS